MQKRSTADARRSVLLSFVVLGLFAALIVLPHVNRTSAISERDSKGLVERTESHVPGLENFDIRTQKSSEINEFFAKSRHDVGKTA